MNQQFRKLALETDAYCDQHYPNHPHYDVLWEQKFAELIVLDFVKVVNATRPAVGGVPAELALDWVEKNVKAYFGVEE